MSVQLQKLNDVFAAAFTDLQSLPAEERDAMHKYARVGMIGASTRIENALLTDSEVSWMDTILAADGHPTAFEINRDLIENKLSKDRERSIEEVAGCRSMLMEIYENSDHYRPLKESDLRGLHFLLLSPYEKASHYVGRYKIQPNSVVEQNRMTGEARVVSKTADAGPMTQSAMTDLVGWYNENVGGNPWPVAVACELVYRFLAIHPFQDGNGRLGRGLMLLALLQCQSPSIKTVVRYLAIDRAVEKHKEQYYSVLNRCSEGEYKQNPLDYHMEYFLLFMVKVLTESLEGISVYRKRYDAQKRLSSSALQILACFKDYPEVRLSTSALMKYTQMPRRTVIYL
jgi:Fic family protein